MNLTFTAYCTPRPQGSMKAFIPKSGKMAGRAIITSDNPHLKSFRQEVAAAAFKAIPDALLGTLLYGKHIPVRLALTFYFAKPPSVSKKRDRHVVKPDLSKLIRATEDALTGIIWNDDAQVCGVYAEKFYGLPERVEVQVMEG